jgi:hypothetical protein
MGLTKLPDGRTFAPQADATIEFRVAETDAIGKTFEQTRIEIGGRVQPADAAQAKWVTVAGTVAEYDQLAKKVWTKLATQLPALSAASSTELFDSLATRRKQAKLEMKAGKGIFGTAGEKSKEMLLKQVHHFGTALKLDPTNMEAAHLQLTARGDLLKHGSTHTQRCDLFIDTWNRHKQFRGQLEYPSEHFVPSYLLIELERKTTVLTAEHHRAFATLNEILEYSLKEPTLFRYRSSWVEQYSRYMKVADWPAKKRQAKLEQWARVFTQQAEQAATMEREMRHAWARYLYRDAVHAVALMYEDGGAKQATPMTDTLICLLSNHNKTPGIRLLNPSEYYVSILNTAIQKYGTTEQKTRLSRKKLPSPSHGRPHVSPYSRRFPPAENIYRGESYVRKHLGKSGNSWPVYQSLVMHDSVIYYLQTAKHGQAVVGIPLHSDGRPDPSKKIRITKVPEAKEPYKILCSRLLGGKIYIGTWHHGLMVYDPEKNSWNRVTPAGGLPAWNVQSMHVDGQSLICYASGLDDRRVGQVRFRYVPKTGKIILLQQYRQYRDPQTKQIIQVGSRALISKVCSPWLVNGSMWGFGAGKLWKDVFSNDPKPQNISKFVEYGAWAGDRYYYATSNGLKALDRQGKECESVVFAAENHYQGNFKGTESGTKSTATMKLHEGRIVANLSVLWLPRDRCLYLLKEKRWVGPLFTASSRNAVATPAGLWTRSGQFLELQHILSLAKKQRHFQNESSRREYAEAFKKKRELEGHKE